MTASAFPPRILLVEDDPGNRLTSAALLEDAGYVVDIADSFAQAKQRLDAGVDYVLVLLDQKLGDGFGADLIPLIRAALPGAKVILVSGDLDPRLRPTLDGWYQKGDDFRRLLLLIKKCLA